MEPEKLVATLKNKEDQPLEAVKGDFREEADPGRKASTLKVMDLVFDRYLQLMHPYMPHLTFSFALFYGIYY